MNLAKFRQIAANGLWKQNTSLVQILKVVCKIGDFVVGFQDEDTWRH